ncbi:MAG: sulfate adenylyltransferase subunit CysN, partial [Parabacteroides sp.]
SLLEFLEIVPIDLDRNYNDFRYPVQYVLRPNQNFRGYSGKVTSGIVRKGDLVKALPSGKVSKVKSIVTYDGELQQAFPPQCVTLTLEDEIDVSRGEMLVHPDNLPLVGRHFKAMLVWMDEMAMDMNKSFYIKQTTNETRAHVDTIHYKVNINTMEHQTLENGLLNGASLPMQLNEIACVTFTTGKTLFFDAYKQNKQTGSFILIDPITNNTSAVGMIVSAGDLQSAADNKDGLTIDLQELGIGKEHFEAICKVCDELMKQGCKVNLLS